MNEWSIKPGGANSNYFVDLVVVMHRDPCKPQSAPAKPANLRCVPSMPFAYAPNCVISRSNPPWPKICIPVTALICGEIQVPLPKCQFDTHQPLMNQPPCLMPICRHLLVCPNEFTGPPRRIRGMGRILDGMPRVWLVVKCAATGIVSG